MGLFPQSFIDDLKAQADIVQVVQDAVPLKKAGSSFKGLCPFHSEKTPSFSVHGEKQIFHCFGCGVGGDVFKFVMLSEGVTFPESIQIVAEKCGIPLPKVSTRNDPSARERQALLEIYEQAEGLGHRLAVRGSLPDRILQKLLQEAGNNPALGDIIKDLDRRSKDSRHTRDRGHFLSSYTKTLEAVFPNVYVFSSEEGVPHRRRDTFVLIAANAPLDLSNLLEAGGHWSQPPFAWKETRESDQPQTLTADQNQWESVVDWASNQDWGGVLTDDFAPVDRLLKPVFIEQDD